MPLQLQLGDISADVVLKRIKNIHLSVHPPSGRVTISAPSRLSLDTIRIFAISKMGWIKRQREKIQAQERETPREYLDRESHFVWGRRYLLKIIEADQAPSVELSHDRMLLRVRPGTHATKRQAIADEWYREQLKDEIPELLAKWEPLMGVKVEKCFVQKMKTLWGSCNARSRTIRLNSELSKKPRGCLEYIVVHELAHLLERSHGPRFIAHMDRFLPNWRFYKDYLNRLPVRHENWLY